MVIYRCKFSSSCYEEFIQFNLDFYFRCIIDVLVDLFEILREEEDVFSALIKPVSRESGGEIN